MSGKDKVYVINKPPPVGGSASPHLPESDSTLSTPSGGPSGRSARSRSDTGVGRALLLAYLGGPVTVSRWLSGGKGMAWTIAGLASAAAAFGLLLFKARFLARLELGDNGALLWLLIVPTVVLAVGAVWARAVSAAGCKYYLPRSRLPRWLQGLAATGLAGLLVPGLGLMLAGRPKRAGWAFLLVGAAAAALVVFSRWDWLWDRSRSPVAPGISGAGLEMILVLVVCMSVVIALAWIVQALDGARRVTTYRSHAAASAVSVALVVSLLAFALVYRPATIAQNLHVTSTSLQVNGYRFIPLGLSEAAAHLDPAKATYLAHAVELYEALGMRGKARAKRLTLVDRANEYTRLARGGRAGMALFEFDSVARRSHYLFDDRSPYHQLARLRSGPNRR
jgi:hypothetical protein